MRTFLPFLALAFLFSCQTPPSSGIPSDELNQFLDQWHIGASKGDSAAYFGRFSGDGRFLGTDPDENWTVDAFWAFSKPYFERGKAWDFTPKERNFYRGEAADLVWFDEVLRTWMGPCRGTGVLEKINGDWKIRHYSLSILVPNSVTREYLELIDSSMIKP